MASTGRAPNTPLRRAFGERIRARRQDLGISQEELAHRAALDRTYVSSVERGQRNIGLENIVRLADALELDAGILLARLGRIDPRH